LDVQALAAALDLLLHEVGARRPIGKTPKNAPRIALGEPPLADPCMRAGPLVRFVGCGLLEGGVEWYWVLPSLPT
jgi:hypothetical protein